MSIIIDTEDLERLLGLTNQLLNLANNISSAIGNANDAASKASVNGKLNKIIALLTDGTFGLAKIDIDVGVVNGLVETVITDLAGVQLAASPVTLPTTPPTGYGGSTAADVWAEVSPSTGLSFGSELDQAGLLAQNLGNYSRLPVSSASFFTLFGNWNGQGLAIEVGTVPSVQLSTIVAGDTVISWLTRVLPAFSWDTDFDGWGVVGAPTLAGSGVWLCSLSDADVDRIGYYLYTPASGPPVRSTLGDENLLLALIPLQYG